MTNTHYTHLTQRYIYKHMVYVKQNIIAYKKIHMSEEKCLSTSEEKVKKSQNYCCFRLAGLTCEHVGRVCRCIYSQHVHAQICSNYSQHVHAQIWSKL